MKDQGCYIKRNKRYSGDGGKDGMYKLHLFSRWRFIQTKRYRGYIPSIMIHDFNQLCKNKYRKGLFIYLGSVSSSIEGNSFNHIRLLPVENLLADIPLAALSCDSLSY